MPVEIERKFLVHRELWVPTTKPVPFRQGYLPSSDGVIVRVRMEGPEARLTIKGPAQGIARAEYEYPIPVPHAEELLASLCLKPQIVKDRYTEEHLGKTWEIDVFHGLNEGLVVAEIELGGVDEGFERPAWTGLEVSEDSRYNNSELAKRPISTW